MLVSLESLIFLILILSRIVALWLLYCYGTLSIYISFMYEVQYILYIYILDLT